MWTTKKKIVTAVPSPRCSMSAIFHLQGNDTCSDLTGPTKYIHNYPQKIYINSEWENDCFLYYGKNLLKMDIWKSFYHFNNKWASDRGLFIFIYTYTQSHMCVCAGTYTHTYIHTPCLRNLKQNSLDAFKMFHILSVIWTQLLKT